MLKSILDTRKLFVVEGLEESQVKVRTTKYLLSLSDSRQIEVLTVQLGNLKKDYRRLEDSSHKGTLDKNEEVQKTQVQILVQIVEGLLSQVKDSR